MTVELYRSWLFDVWGRGDERVAAEILAEDLVDHDACPVSPQAATASAARYRRERAGRDRTTAGRGGLTGQIRTDAVAGPSG